MPAQTNATVTRAQGTSTGESFDGPAGAGDDKWRDDSAPANAYLRERRDRQQTAATGDVVLERTLIVNTADPPVDWRNGDRVTYKRDGDTTPSTGKVKMVERSAITDPGVPADVITTRLTLETQ